MSDTLFFAGEKVVYQWEHYTNSISHFTRQKTGLFVKHRRPLNQFVYVKFPGNKRNSKLSLNRIFKCSDNDDNTINFTKD